MLSSHMLFLPVCGKFEKTLSSLWGFCIEPQKADKALKMNDFWLTLRSERL